MTDDPVIIALDVESAAEARDLVRQLGRDAGFYKVGLELFTAAGPDFVRELIGGGKRVFLDLKFHDIGETVRRATAQVARLGASFLTVHGQPQVMRAAVEGRGEHDLRIFAVTVLTSLNDRDLERAGYDCSVRELVNRVVDNALEFRVDGLIASALDASAIRRHIHNSETAKLGPELLLITPGVRSRGAAKGDQKRVATPAEALRDGADYLVIGRQVTRAADPCAALGQIRDEIAAGVLHA
jgi:orotidine-5'-phosphate decarboxylase